MVSIDTQMEELEMLSRFNAWENKAILEIFQGHNYSNIPNMYAPQSFF